MPMLVLRLFISVYVKIAFAEIIAPNKLFRFA